MKEEFSAALGSPPHATVADAARVVEWPGRLALADLAAARKHQGVALTDGRLDGENRQSAAKKSRAPSRRPQVV